MLFTAAIWHTQLYSNLKFDDVVLAGFPRFVTANGSSPLLSLPFWMLAVVSLFIPLSKRFLAKSLVPALCAIAGFIFTSSLMYCDHNYIDEMRMVRSAADDNWKDVLDKAAEAAQTHDYHDDACHNGGYYQS